MVAVSTLMACARENRADQKDFFLKGYREMLRRLEPEKIICYNEPFPEMEGDIVYVDYELSSWKHDGDDIGKARAAQPQEGIRIIKRTGFVMSDDAFLQKGSGSAFGGEWKPSPNKPEDNRLIGEPGDIINSIARNGYESDTVIGENGYAVAERHYSDHHTPNVHSPIHDHIVGWERGFPDFGKPINYFNMDVPYLGYVFDLFKARDGSTIEIIAKEASPMRKIRLEAQNTPEENRFKTISDFKWSIACGREVGFEHGEKTYGIIRSGDGLDDGPYILYESYSEASEQSFDTVDALLDCELDGTRLQDIIRQVKVLWRNV